MRGVLGVLLVLGVMVLQVSVVNRMVFPGGGGPDLVLLCVVLVALGRGAVGGAVVGFLIGVVADVLPPSAHVMGQYALVFCLVGFAVGRAGERAPGTAAVTVIVALMVAPLLAAGIGGLLGDPRVDWPAPMRVWPSMVMYNLAIAAAGFWVVSRRSGDRPRRRAVPTGAYPVRRRM
ncbi:rod shape-determining protein MreD [Sphaerisporangium aureirubrum]|uniref:Rod shape-determining protein MreD n=1 Tax=Sphaerisporangium aureirubrum TaxID=1544736 RepID=A0ABW1NAN1_9ACTN